jgi:hypothetical protein
MALSGNSALELSLYLLGSPLFKRIGATAREQRESHRAQDRHGLHPLTLKTKQFIARELKRSSDEALERGRDEVRILVAALTLRRFNSLTHP